MQLDTKITLTRSELIELVRKAYPEIKNIRKVKIVEEDVREWLKKRTEDESNDWIDVPKDWKHYRCPTDFDPDTKIDVIQRNLVESHNIYANTIATPWSQDDYSEDIVKYRVSKQSN